MASDRDRTRNVLLHNLPPKPLCHLVKQYRAGVTSSLKHLPLIKVNVLPME